MSGEDSSSEKTEDPSQKKKTDSRKNGQVAVSKELSSFFIIGLFVFMLGVFHQEIISILSADLVSSFTTNSYRDNTSLVIYTMGVVGANMKFVIAAVVFAGLLGGGLSVIQMGGLVINEKAFNIDFNRLNPVENFKQIYSKKGFIKFLCNLFEITVIVIVGCFYVNSNLPEILNINYAFFMVAIWVLTMIIFKLIIIVLSMHFGFSMLYLYLEKKNLFNQLKMTKNELKDEGKELNGDPEIKGKRKELFKEFMEEDSMYDLISQSTLVLANPTHIAIVVMYSPLKWKLPIVLLKLKDEKAQLVFKLARKIGIPIIRDKPLARNLYDIAEVGKFVPSSCIKDVAEVIGKNIELFPKVTEELLVMQQNRSSELTV